MHANVYVADRDGAPFRQIGEIHDPVFATGLYCGTLYELPQQVGGLARGTLLWAASVGQKPEYRPMAIKIYRSEDEGRSRSYLSEIRSPNQGGLWEPEFTVDREGALAMFFSDETDQAEHSQTIKKVRTSDGLNRRCSETCRSHDWCPNYSSALLPSENGMEVLEFTSDWKEQGCFPSYAWAPWRPEEEVGGEMP